MQSSKVESRQSLMALQWRSGLWHLSPIEPVLNSLCPFQGQGPWTEGVWLLHRWHQPVHSGHRAGLAGSCQPEFGHEGWHLCGGKLGLRGQLWSLWKCCRISASSFGGWENGTNMFSMVEFYHWTTFPYGTNLGSSWRGKARCWVENGGLVKKHMYCWRGKFKCSWSLRKN